MGLSGGDKKKKESGPPINATSKDEEKFIQYVAHVSSLAVFNQCRCANPEGEIETS